MPLVTGIWGPEKTGKSTFALTFPTPIRYFEFDIGGFERAEHRFRKEVEAGLITVTSYPMPIQLSLHPGNDPLEGWEEIWYDFVKDYLDAVGTLRSPSDYKSLVIDTATNCWVVCHTAYLQGIQTINKARKERLRERLQPIEYAEPNRRMTSVLQSCKSRGKELVLVHHETDVYESRLNEQTGRMEDYKTTRKTHEGFNKTPNIADIMLHTGKKGGKPMATITTCGLTLQAEGRVIDESPTYEKMMDLVAMSRAMD